MMSSIPIMFYSNNQSIARKYVIEPLEQTFQNSLGRFKLYKNQHVEKSTYTFLDPMFFPISTLDALKPILCLVCICVSSNDNAEQLQNTIVKHFLEQVKRMPNQVTVFIISYNHSDETITRINKQAKKLYSQMQSHNQQNMQLNLIDGEQKKINNQIFFNLHDDLKKLVTSKLYDLEKIMNQTQLNNLCQLMLNKLNYFIMCAYIFNKQTVIGEILQFLKMFLRLNTDNEDKNKYQDFRQRTIDTKQIVVPIYEDFYHLLGIYQEYMGQKSQFMVKQPLNHDVIQQTYQFVFTKQDFYDKLGSNLLLPMSIYQQQKEVNQTQINDQHNAIELIFGQLKTEQYSCYQIVAYLCNILFVSGSLSCNEIDDIFENMIIKPFFGDKISQLHMKFMWTDLILHYNKNKQVQYKYILKKLHCQICILDMFNPQRQNYQNLYMEFKQECKQYLLQKFSKQSSVMAEQLELFTQVFLVEQQYQQQLLQTEMGLKLLQENQLYQFFNSKVFCNMFLNDTIFNEALQLEIKRMIIERCDILEICKFIQTLSGTENHSIFLSLSQIIIELGIHAIKQLTDLCKEQIESNHPIDLQLRCLQVIVETMDRYQLAHPEAFSQDQSRYIQCQCFATGIISKSLSKVIYNYQSTQLNKRHNYNFQNELNFMQLTTNRLKIEKLYLDNAEVFSYQFNNLQNVHFSVSVDIKYLHIILSYNMLDTQYIDQYALQNESTQNEINLSNENALSVSNAWPFKYIKTIFRQSDNDPTKDRIIIKKHDSPNVKLPYQISDETQNLEQLDSYFYLHLIGVSVDKENWFIVYYVDIYPSQMKSITEYIKRQSQADESILNDQIIVKQTQEISSITSFDGQKSNLQPLIINMIPYQNNINAKLMNQEIYYNTEQNLIFQVRISHPSQMQISFQLSDSIKQIGPIHFLQRQPKQMQPVSQRQSEVSGQDFKAPEQVDVISEIKIIEYKENERIFLSKLFYIVIPVHVINNNLNVDIFQSQSQQIQYFAIIKSDNQKRICQQKFSLKPQFLFQTHFSVMQDEYQIQVSNMTKYSFKNVHIALEQNEAITSKCVNIPQYCSYYMQVPISKITKLSMIIDLESFLFKDSSLFCNSFIQEDQLLQIQYQNSSKLNSLQQVVEQQLSDDNSDFIDSKKLPNEELIRATTPQNIAKSSILLYDNINLETLSQLQLPEIIMRLQQWIIQNCTIIRKQNYYITNNNHIIRMKINQKYRLQYTVINKELYEAIIKIQNEDGFIVYGPTRIQMPPGQRTLTLDVIPIRTGQMILPQYQLEDSQFTLEGITLKQDIKVYTTW